MSKVFISYSSKDSDWVKNYLLVNLEGNGIDCHIDYRDFEIGRASLINMEQAVETCEKTILVLTPNWVNSEFTQFEGLMLQTEDPIGLRKKIIPIMLSECEPPKRLKIFTHADFKSPNDWDMQLQRVTKQIKRDFGISNPDKKYYPELPEKYVDTNRLPQTGFELFGRQKELQLLNDAWKADDTKVLCFVAYGGVGKSTLIKKWTEKMRWENYRGAERVFAWSFYSQGTSERVTSADMFINAALKWFGDEDPTKGSPWDKGKRLAKLICQQKTLLLLDGLEPLQSGNDFDKGKIKDPALEVLIKELSKFNNGLCVITTREYVPILDRYPKRALQYNLEHLSEEAGRELLKINRIQGTPERLGEAVSEFGCHALAINLLGSYLRQYPGNSVEKAFDIPDLPEVNENDGKHPCRVIEAFAEKLGKESKAISLLKLLGLFDRPVEQAAIDAIIKNTPLPGLNSELFNISFEKQAEVLRILKKHNLLLKDSEHRLGVLDCHPIIREHFGDKLQKENSEAWKEAHSRLYEFYKNLPEKHLPDTVEELEPLFAAVRHGCLAGKHQDTVYDVFWMRIRRKQEHFNINKLGAFGSDISCISSFFESLWKRPSSNLNENFHAGVLAWAGFTLRAVGKLREAALPMKAGLEVFKTQNNWKECSANAGNLSELFLHLGDVNAAQEYAKQSVDFADKSEDDFEMEANRTAYADALLQSGNLKAAERQFSEAENMQKKRQPGYNFLYSLQGFQYCDLLISLGQYEVVLERSKTTLKWATVGKMSILSRTVDLVTIGKALMLQSLSKKSTDFSESENHLNQAVTGFRKAGTQHQLPTGLFARATLYRHQTNFPAAWAGLDEAREIAEYGSIKLHLTDYFLEAARVIEKQLAVSNEPYAILENGEQKELSKAEMVEKFSAFFKKAERLVDECGYHRRDGEVEELRAIAAKIGE